MCKKCDHSVDYGNFVVNSQHPEIAPVAYRHKAMKNYLPELIRAWQHIEQNTGYRWKCTSYWRDSPSHSLGVSMDIAPDFTSTAEPLYSVSQGSDPVLYKREALIRKLQVAAATFEPGPFAIGVFIEPDHLHVQAMDPKEGGPIMRIVKWKIAKPVYHDTYQRMQLPLLK